MGLRAIGAGRPAGVSIFLVAAVVAATGITGAGAKPPGGWSRTKKIAPGVYYTKTKDTSGPYRIFMLSINPGKVSTLDTILGTDRLPKTETTTSMASRSGAIAAINGDYATATGRPVYTFAHDGYLDQTPTSWGRNFSITTTETATYIGHPTTDAWMSDPATGLTYEIKLVNEGPPGTKQIALFTASGGTLEKPPAYACSARLFPLETPRLRTEGPGAEALHTVDEVLCSTEPMLRAGGVVISTPSTGTQATVISSLIPGQQLELGWSLGWSGVFDTIGGNPTLLENGIISSAVYGDTPFHGRNPRTGVGTTADGRVLLIVVDGRQPGYSVGMTLEEFALLFYEMGATWALNLDGGGSSTFVVNGVIKNRPSDGSERPVSSALVLLPGPDPGELASVEPDPAAPSMSDLWELIATDPGSTGGMASWMESKGRPLPAGLDAAARAFNNRR
jgi:large repetitive protein